MDVRWKAKIGLFYGLASALKSCNINELWAVSSAAEHRSYTPGATGSNPVPPTTYSLTKCLLRLCCRFHGEQI